MAESCDALIERTSVVEEVVKYLREIEQRDQDLGGESVVGRMVENQCFRESNDKGLDKGFYGFRERKKKRLSHLEDGLSWEREEFMNGVKKREAELDEQLESVHEHIERLEAAQTEVQGLRQLALEKLREIESREHSLRSELVALAEKESKVGEIQRTLDGRIRVVEEREKESMLKRGEIIRLLDGRITAVEEREKAFVLKKRELVEMEKELNKKREEFVKEVNLADERLREQDKLRNSLVERFGMAEKKLEGVNAMIEERLKEIEFRESVACESVAVIVKEADLIRETVENRMEEFEKMIREFNSSQDDKMRELISKEKQLDVMSRELVKEAEFRDGELTERERSAHKLLNRLELAQENVLNLKAVFHERYKEIGLKETELSTLTDWIEKKMDEVDLKANELEEQEKRIRKKEKNLISRKNELLMKEQKLDLKEKYLHIWKKELKVDQRELNLVQKLNEQRLEELERRENNLKSVRDFTSNWFKEHRAVREKLRSERNLVEQRARDLEVRNRQLESMMRELESTGKQMSDRRKNLELKQLGHIEIPDDHVKTDANESADLKFFVRMDGKDLQKFLNDPVKDLESVGDEVFTVLHLSSDPAKLVLDAMAGFYPPHLREDDVESNVRKTCIVLLEQLIRMSRKIQPSVKEEAIELASAWKSKMGATSENQLEVLGFLHLVAAYNIASYFKKDDIISLLKMVDQHRQTPELCRILGATESIGGNFSRPI